MSNLDSLVEPADLTEGKSASDYQFLVVSRKYYRYGSVDYSNYPEGQLTRIIPFNLIKDAQSDLDRRKCNETDNRVEWTLYKRNFQGYYVAIDYESVYDAIVLRC
jgi:hypothetical protein